MCVCRCVCLCVCVCECMQVCLSAVDLMCFSCWCAARFCMDFISHLTSHLTVVPSTLCLWQLNGEEALVVNQPIVCNRACCSYVYPWDSLIAHILNCLYCTLNPMWVSRVHGALVAVSGCQFPNCPNTLPLN